MSRRLLIIALLAGSLLFTACSKRYRLHREELREPSAWPSLRGDLGNTGAFEEATFSGKLDTLWKKSMAGKPAAGMTIHHGFLVYPDTKKRIRFFDIETGKYQGRINSKGSAQSGVMLADSVAYFCISPAKNRLTAYDLVNRRKLWRRNVKDVTSGPIILHDRLIIGLGDGAIQAITLDSGHNEWSFRTDGRIVAAACYYDGRLFQPADDGKLYALDVESGELLFAAELEGPLVAGAVADEFIFTADILGWVYALSPVDGSLVWKRKLDAPVWAAPAVANGYLFVASTGGEILKLKAATGDEVWRYDATEVIRAAPLIVGEYLAVGTMGGHLHLLRTDDGSEVAVRDLESAIVVPPVTDGRHLMVATEVGKIICFGDRNEPHRRADSGVNPIP